MKRYEPAFIPNPGVGVWRAIVTAPKKELVVIEQLKAHNCEIYRPMTTKNRKVNGRGKTEKVAVSVFPSVVFAKPLCTILRPFRDFQGINLAFEMGVSDREIQRLHNELSKRMEIVKDEGNQKDTEIEQFTTGDQVETKDGVWFGVVTEVDAEKRVTLLCTLFGRGFTMQRSPEELRHSLS
jgi:transcription antitermination factor NusG